ncbi:hypothetical protein AVEN_209782-1 [Araneus ventricosus]|uniref:Uncharacterized protein n=1 Tax=Araneus ventricosus TaxID=182803 RepID=A0A4Y2NNF9_ARAVE|nr:hypothetical protein AVEN_209782-1 [Araneus ventricosus]
MKKTGRSGEVWEKNQGEGTPGRRKWTRHKITIVPSRESASLSPYLRCLFPPWNYGFWTERKNASGDGHATLRRWNEDLLDCIASTVI